MSIKTASELSDLAFVAAAPASLDRRERSKQEEVVEYLREAILRGRLRPGQRLRQQEVANTLSVSWTPIREAFRRLEGEGLVRVEHNRGAIVTELSAADFDDIYQLRILVEPVVARLASENADAATLEAAEALLGRLEKLAAAATLDWPQFLRVERELDAAVYGAAGRRRLGDLVLALRDASNRYLIASIVLEGEPARHLSAQRALVAAARRHDGPDAHETLQRALTRVRERMLPLLEARERESLQGDGPA